LGGRGQAPALPSKQVRQRGGKKNVAAWIDPWRRMPDTPRPFRREGLPAKAAAADTGRSVPRLWGKLWGPEKTLLWFHFGKRPAPRPAGAALQPVWPNFGLR